MILSASASRVLLCSRSGRKRLRGSSSSSSSSFHVLVSCSPSCCSPIDDGAEDKSLRRSFSSFAASSASTVVRNEIDREKREQKEHPRAIYFTGGGNYYYWQAGAAMYLKETFDLSGDVPMIGASAGSITATLLKLDADFNQAVDRAIDMANQTRIYERKAELALVWGPLIREWLQHILPDDIENINCSDLHLTVTPAHSIKQPKLVSNFKSKQDIIDAIMASVHIPIFLDGKFWTKYRGETVVDGSFWWFVTRKFNQRTCPIPNHIQRDEVYIVDWRKDVAHRERLRKEIAGSAAFRALKPNFVYEMVEAGYLFMKKQHNQGDLPWKILNKSIHGV